MAKIFFKEDSSDQSTKRLHIDFSTQGYTNDTNINSSFGTIFSQSTSASAGLTESVITPGIRFIKFAMGIMSIFKKMSDNFNTIRSKVTRIMNIMNSFSTGKHNHIRKSVIKRKVRKA